MGSSTPSRYWTRRNVVRAIGGMGLVGSAGCSGDGGGNSVTPTEESTATPTEQSTPTSTSTPSPTPGPNISALEADLTDVSFQGELFDTHVHWHGARDTRHDILDPQTLATRYGDNDVGASALFTASTDVTSEYASILQDVVTDDVDYLPFLEPYGWDHITEGDVVDVYDQHPDVFWGIGEIVFYSGILEGTSLTEHPWPKLFNFSASEDVPLMIHPTLQQESGLKTMLSDYPDATVLAHGGEFNMEQSILEPILRNHENLYWTLDAGSMLSGLVLRADDATDFANRFDQRKSDYYNLVENTLPWMMNAAPDRVCWGTDLGPNWNTDPKVFTRVLNWTQAAIDSIPTDQQDKYAYQNARSLFGV